MGIKDKILVILTACGAFASAVFYVLFKQAKAEKLEAKTETKLAEEEKNKAQQAAQTIQKSVEIQTKIVEKMNEGKRESEKLKQDLNNNDVDIVINASNQLLDNIRKKGRIRNGV